MVDDLFLSSKEIAMAPQSPWCASVWDVDQGESPSIQWLVAPYHSNDLCGPYSRDAMSVDSGSVWSRSIHASPMNQVMRDQVSDRSMKRRTSPWICMWEAFSSDAMSHDRSRSVRSESFSIRAGMNHGHPSVKHHASSCDESATHRSSGNRPRLQFAFGNRGMHVPARCLRSRWSGLWGAWMQSLYWCWAPSSCVDFKVTTRWSHARKSTWWKPIATSGSTGWFIVAPKIW